MPDDNMGLELNVRDADVSNVKVAQCTMFSAMMKLRSGLEANVLVITVGENLEPEN